MPPPPKRLHPLQPEDFGPEMGGWVGGCLPRVDLHDLYTLTYMYMPPPQTLWYMCMYMIVSMHVCSSWKTSTCTGPHAVRTRWGMFEVSKLQAWEVHSLKVIITHMYIIFSWLLYRCNKVASPVPDTPAGDGVVWCCAKFECSSNCYQWGP